MIFTVNATISIAKFVDVDGKKNFWTPVTWIAAYIEPIDEEVAITYEGQGAYENFRLLTWDMTIAVGDKINDGSRDYIVLGKRSFKSMVWSHTEAILQSKFD